MNTAKEFAGHKEVTLVMTIECAKSKSWPNMTDLKDEKQLHVAWLKDYDEWMPEQVRDVQGSGAEGLSVF